MDVMGSWMRKGAPSMVQWLGWLTLLVFGGGGVVLMVFVQDRSMQEAVLGGTAIAYHLLLGVASGLFIGYLAWSIVSRRFMQRVLTRYATLVGPLMASRADRWFVSLCAGAGEELFFRGAVQHWLGIPLTAVVFVALHGYLDPRSWRVSLYGVIMTLAMLLLGFLADRFGLLAPMIAHALIDVVLLGKLRKHWLHSGSNAPDRAVPSLAQETGTEQDDRSLRR